MVGRPGVGAVRWLEEVDVRGIEVQDLVRLSRGGVEVRTGALPLYWLGDGTQIPGQWDDWRPSCVWPPFAQCDVIRALSLARGFHRTSAVPWCWRRSSYCINRRCTWMMRTSRPLERA